jgi:hypothetical protein
MIVIRDVFSMDLSLFKEYLTEKKLDADKIENALDIVKQFAEFLNTDIKSLENVEYEDLHSFSEVLITQDLNKYDNFIYLLRFSYFMKNDPMTIAVMETIDGGEMMVNFSERLKETHGEEIRDKVFKEIGVPPLGLHPKKRPKITMKLINRLAETIGHEETKIFLNTGLRDRYTQWYAMARKTYLDVDSMDEFLKIKKDEFFKTLNTHFEEKSLFFTQVIDQEVMDYVNKHPTIESGILDGNLLSVSKIPYMTKEFLEAKRNGDTRKMKYYFCHNPWFREGLLEDDLEINPIACQISCGYYKDYWEGVLNAPVDVELTGSLVLGNDTCSFDIHLPEDVIKTGR